MCAPSATTTPARTISPTTRCFRCATRPENVAAEIQKLIAGTPLLVKTGRWRAQDNTNILAFLDNVSHGIGCAGMPTTIILASDGIEDSELCQALPHATPICPPPTATRSRAAPSFEILGLGQGAGSPRLTNHLRDDWASWARAAGFAQFVGLNDW